MMLRPMRPNPLMPTFTAMTASSETIRCDRMTAAGMSAERRARRAARPSRHRETALATLSRFYPAHSAGSKTRLQSIGQQPRGTTGRIWTHERLAPAHRRVYTAAGSTPFVSQVYSQRSSLWGATVIPLAPRDRVGRGAPCRMYLLYSLLLVLAALVGAPWFLYQALRYKKYVGSLRQRLGYLPMSFNIDGEESIWIHAVSVGEALTARALVADLQAALSAPAPLPVDDDDGRAAGGAAQPARRRRVFYFPFDWAFIVRRTLDLVRPRLFIMMETEIWPNLLRECRAAASRRRWSTAASRRGRIRATGWFGRSSAACSPTSIASACRARSRRAASSTSAPTRRASPSPAA